MGGIGDGSRFESMPGHDIWKRSQLPEDELKKEIIRLFVEEGQTVNHTVYLIDYKLNTGKVCDIIREHIRALQMFAPVGWE